MHLKNPTIMKSPRIRLLRVRFLTASILETPTRIKIYIGYA
jgi:hypothetical protein